MLYTIQSSRKKYKNIYVMKIIITAAKTSLYVISFFKNTNNIITIVITIHASIYEYIYV